MNFLHLNAGDAESEVDPLASILSGLPLQLIAVLMQVKMNFIGHLRALNQKKPHMPNESRLDLLTDVTIVTDK